MKPVRVQRKRSKGWKMPEDTVYVGRPSVWGNPYWHAQKFHGVELALRLYRETCQGFWEPALVLGIPTADGVYQDHCRWLKRLGGHPLEIMRRELRGKNLACWCRLDQPCHADVLLELANVEYLGSAAERKP